MPRISSISSISKASATLAACAEAVSEGANGLSNGLSNLSRIQKTYSGFGEGVCTCARCMRRAGPIREDVENKLVQITYALANVYDDSPDLEVRVTDEHRARAEQMMACVESGDIATLRQSFLEIEEQESEGILEGGTATEIATYLIISAAQVGQADVIRLLAEWDADMEETDSIRRGRPLMHAANNGHTAAVKAMIECGADPEATDDNGYTALMVAVFSDRSSAAEALVDGGACVDAQDRAGRTALSYAAMYGSTDCIYLLASRGADVGHVDYDGNTPLELAEGSGRQSAVDALKKLQLRVKMQEKRKVKASKGRGDYRDLDAAALEAKEAEAARAAAELLEQLEKEEAAKSAKAAKKKKKGKHKSAAAEADAEAQQSHQQPDQQHPGVSKPRHQQHNISVESSTTAVWPSQEGRQDVVHNASHKTADGKHPRKQLKQSASTSPGANGLDHTQKGDAGCQDSHIVAADAIEVGHQQAASVDASVGSSNGDAAAAASHLDDLRSEWEALLEQAARCRDSGQQPTMLARVAEMLPRCSDAGISVKYGRKVLQRLQAVEPARRSLQAALSAQPCSVEELEAALTACKVCRCLLEDDLLQVAEDVLRNLTKEREEVRLQQLQQQQQQQQMQQELMQREQSKQQQLHRQQRPLEQQQRHQQVRQSPQPQAQHTAQMQQQQPQHRPLLEQHQLSNGHHLATGVGVPMGQLPQSRSSCLAQPPVHCLAQPPVHCLAQPPVHSCQSDESSHQQQPADRALQFPQQRGQEQPAVSPRAAQPPIQRTVQHAQPLMSTAPQQNLHTQAQQSRSIQSYQDLAAGAHPRSFNVPESTMCHLQPKQQQLHAMQAQPSQHQQPEQQSLQHLLSKTSHTTPGNHAAVGQNLVTSQQQQAPVTPLQLLQHQQQLFTPQMHGSQQQPTFNQLQRQLPGVLSGSGLHQGLMAPSPAGTPPSLLGSPGVMSHLMTPVSQAAVHSQQQQQQQPSSFWPPARPGLVSPGAYVGQPVGPAAGSRLSLEMLAPGSRITAATAAGGQLTSAGSNIGRRGSLSTPVSAVSSGQPEADMLDDLMHPAYAMANALLSDDEQECPESVVECKMCQKSVCDTCCLPCGCLLMCQVCAAAWRQRGESLCPFCKGLLDDFAVV